VKIFLPITLWLSINIGYSQHKDSVFQPASKIAPLAKTATGLPAAKLPFKPEIFTNGFIDILTNGQINASARFVRIYIGEPGKFAIPLSIFSGVSANNFQNTYSNISKTNESLVTNFINPLSGLANVSIEGVLFRKRDTSKVTKFGLLYHIGERVLTGRTIGLVTDPNTGRPVNFFNSFGSLGIYFQTGAWDKNNARNLGAFWLTFRYIGCYSSPKDLKEMIPVLHTNGIYYGYSIACGIEITNSLNTKIVYYKYNKKPEIEYYLPIYQFSFNYNLKR
jgi:hypothetical protein